MSDALPAGFFEHVVADCPDAIVYADAAGAIRYWNAAASRIFGYAAGEALGQSLDLIIPEGGVRARHWQGYRRVMEGAASRYGAGDILSVPAMRKDGRRISIEFTIVPLAGEARAPAGIVAILRDVTTRFEAMRALRRQVEALKNPGRPS